MNCTPSVWRSAGHSAVGSAHLNSGKPCQDWFSQANSGTGRHVIAISDGAGSAKFSEEGARIASEKMVDILANFPRNLNEITVEEGIIFGSLVGEALEHFGQGIGAEKNDLACTLLAAAFEDGHSYFWQVGDGAWIVATSDNIESATWPYKGEFNNETVFITSKNWEQYWTHAFYENIEAVMGFTDGLELFCLDAEHKRPHLPFVSKIFTVLKSSPPEDEIKSKIDEMLKSSLITDREDDDLTMVLAWKA